MCLFVHTLLPFKYLDAIFFIGLTKPFLCDNFFLLGVFQNIFLKQTLFLGCNLKSIVCFIFNLNCFNCLFGFNFFNLLVL